MLYNTELATKLRNSGLRPTKQRIKISEILFNNKKTFHFTINDLVKMIEDNSNEKISLATVYNTIHAFKKKGYLKQIPINSDQSFFDTNITHHHHFYDEKNKEFFEINNSEIEPIKINKDIPGKKIKSIEVLVKVENK